MKLLLITLLCLSCAYCLPALSMNLATELRSGIVAPRKVVRQVRVNAASAGKYYDPFDVPQKNTFLNPWWEPMPDTTTLKPAVEKATIKTEWEGNAAAQKYFESLRADAKNAGLNWDAAANDVNRAAEDLNRERSRFAKMQSSARRSRAQSQSLESEAAALITQQKIIDAAKIRLDGAVRKLGNRQDHSLRVEKELDQISATAA